MKNVTTPARRALAVLDKPPRDVDAAEPVKRISAKVRTGIDAMVSGGAKTISAAAEKAGLSREHFTRELAKPHIAQHLRDKVQRHLAIMAARAGYVKGELLDSANEMVRDRASSFVLGLAGIAPADPNQRAGTGQQPGLQIVIMGGPMPHVIGPADAVTIEPDSGAATDLPTQRPHWP